MIGAGQQPWSSHLEVHAIVAQSRKSSNFARSSSRLLKEGPSVDVALLLLLLHFFSHLYPLLLMGNLTGNPTGNPNGLRHGRRFDNLQQPIWRWIQRLPWTESPILQLLVLRLLLLMLLQLLLLLLLLLAFDTAYLLPMLLLRLPCNLLLCLLLGNLLWLLCLLLCNLLVLPHLRHRMCPIQLLKRLPLFGAGGYSVLRAT